MNWGRKALSTQEKRPFYKSPWVWVAVAVFTAFYVLSALLPFPRSWHQLYTNLMYDPIPLAAAIACFYAYRRVGKSDKTVLLFLGLGTLALAFGEIAWAYYEVELGS